MMIVYIREYSDDRSIDDIGIDQQEIVTYRYGGRVHLKCNRLIDCVIKINTNNISKKD